MKQPLELLKEALMRVRTEIAFVRGDQAHGGSHHAAELARLQTTLHELQEEIAAWKLSKKSSNISI